MAVFGIETEESEIVNKFMVETNSRLGHKSKTPFFDGKVIEMDGVKYIIYIRTLYPPYFLFGLGFWIFGFIFTGRFMLTWFVPGLIVLSPMVFYHWLIFYIILRFGLYKKGYKGKMRLL